MKTKLFKYAFPILILIGGFWFYASKSGMFLDRDALIAEASAQVEAGDLEAAEETIQPLLELWDVPNELWLFVANINRIEGDFATALTYLNEIDDTTPDISQQAQMFRAEANLQLGHLYPASQQFEAVLAEDASQVSVRRQLIFLLNVAGLIQESLPHMLTLVNEGRSDPELLLMLCDTSIPRRNDPLIAKGLENNPEDPFVQIAAGFIDQESNNPTAAMEHFQAALRQKNDFAVAWVNALKMAIALQDQKLVTKLLADKPASAHQVPDTWIIKGDLCRNSGMHTEAARCYWEAARIAPDHIASHFQLGRMLRDLGREADSQACSEWANELSHLAAISKSINKNTPDIPGITKIAEQLLKLNRVNEARAWVSLGQQIDPGSLGQLMAKLQRSQRSPSVEFPPGPASRIDLSMFPAPEWDELQVIPDVSPASQSPADSLSVAFQDVSSSANVDFQYQNGSDPTTEGPAIYEYTGGGVGVLDFDLDGWPDVYLSQGSPQGPEQPGQESDQLFRNRGGTNFENITQHAGIRAQGFGQGVAIGDIDHDGFPDVYVANFGRNQLWQNNGDGTFTDITESSGIDGTAWTTSCAIADLDGDGLPELFDVNYLEGENLLTQKCYSQGLERVCTPVVFSPAQDRIWKNTGEGSFSDETSPSGLDKAQGNGLGVLIADFDGDSRLDAFIANDAVANHYWINQSSHTLNLEESALLSGLAMNADGRAEACMGIAAGDVDGNGVLDLFVTNFYQESNTLYQQQQPHLFIDETRNFSLHDPGYELLGFGTQFLDADLDGWQDLVIVNGDIDDFSFIEGRKEKMPPLFLRNLEGQSFAENQATQSGDFFQQKMLGRSLARLDWNRDGKPDFVAGTLESPTQLVENRTDTNHHWISLRLIGVNAARDAVGTQVTIETDGRRQTQQLTAGDGYQSSNEKRLFFGVGSAKRIDRLKVRWPGGEEQNIGELETGRHYSLREGHPIVSLMSPQSDQPR